jgi:S-adenosylmethionine:tRNA ribosyltransferase-isomerase
MDIARYQYHLPGELIAQYPRERGEDRLLVVDRASGEIHHRVFEDLYEYLKPGDLLVLNDTRVIPARLLGRKESGGKVELLLVRQLAPGVWSCLAKTSKPPRPGMEILFENGLTGQVQERRGEFWQVAFSEADRVLAAGRIPLPPYITRPPEEIDEQRYQTVYAQKNGSVAAPTAGLHFTEGFLEKLRARGVEAAFITLHVGPGTFVPVRTERVEDHRMHEEEFLVSDQAARAVNQAMDQGRRIMAVGTTTTRVLEFLMARHGRIISGEGSTDLFIFEGFPFRCVGALLTNFHLPRSTLLMLVTAFGGYGLIMDAYRCAVQGRYRFFSYGDAMLIL